MTEQNRESFHITNLGSFATSDLKADRDGYVHLTTEAVLAGSWDSDPEDDYSNPDDHLRSWAEEVAKNNVAAYKRSEEARLEWVNNNG